MEIVLIMVLANKTKMFHLLKKLIKRDLILTGKANKQTAIILLEDHKLVLIFHLDKQHRIQIISQSIQAKSSN